MYFNNNNTQAPDVTSIHFFFLVKYFATHCRYRWLLWAVNISPTLRLNLNDEMVFRSTLSCNPSFNNEFYNQDNQNQFSYAEYMYKSNFILLVCLSNSTSFEYLNYIFWRNYLKYINCTCTLWWKLSSRSPLDTF